MPALAASKALQGQARAFLKPLRLRSLAMALERPPLRSMSRMRVPLPTFFSAAIDSTVTCACRAACKQF